MSEKRVLLVEDNPDWLAIYSSHLKGEDYALDTAGSVQQAFKLLETQTYEVVVTDLKMIGFGDEYGGFNVIKKVKEEDENTQVLVITAYGTRDIAFRAVNQGALDLVNKPPDPDKFRMSIRMAIQAKQDLVKNNPSQKRVVSNKNQPSESTRKIDVESSGLLGIRGNSQKIQETFQAVSYAVLRDLPVFIFGEVGTGKTLIARAIYGNSNRKSRPFSYIEFSDFLVNRSAISKNLKRLKGGTFVLDAITISSEEEREVLRDFVKNLHDEDIRLISVVTTEDTGLESIKNHFEIDKDTFSEMAKIPVYVPPLRQRKDGDDIPILIGYFIRNHMNEISSASDVVISPDAMNLLVSYEYQKANVKELFDIIRRALNFLGDQGEILPEHLLVPLDARPPENKSAGDKSNTYALFIGINAYQNLRRLNKAVQDASDLHNLLLANDMTQKSITLLIDKHATKSNIMNELETLSKKTTPEDKVLIFFSGHGAQIGGRTNGEYLCPVDGDVTNPEKTFISSDEFTSVIRNIRASQLIVIMDACHAGGVGEPKDTSLVLKAGLSEKSYNQISKGQGRVILASCKPDEVSWELQDMQNGLFTHFLLQGLKGASARKDGTIWLSNLFGYVSENLPKHKPQHPYLKSETEDLMILFAPLYSKEEVSTDDKKEIQYNLPVIRELISKSFNDDALTIFCQDYFNDVYDDFSAGMSKAIKIGKLLDYCQRNLLIDKLIARIAEYNPRRFEVYKAKIGIV